ncbi:MAG: NFACT family protein [Thermodesulfobacteriota bacterium]
MAELDEAMRGGVVSKIHQPDERQVLIKIFRRGREERLLISTHPKFSRAHLTASRFENPPTPKRFCAFLRSRITNAHVEGVSQTPGERIIRVALKKTEGEAFTLIAELTGKSANIILVDENETVLDALKHFPVEGSMRGVEPGIKLEPLPPFKGEVKEKPVELGEGETWNQAAERVCSTPAEDEKILSRRSTLRRAIKSAEKRLKKKLRNLEADGKEAEKNIEGARLGELLVANYKDIRKGMTKIEVEDYYKSPLEKVAVPLDERLGPQENIDRIFKKAKKAKTTLKLLKVRLPVTRKELEYIDELAYELEAAENEEDIETLREELIEAGYLKEKAKPRTGRGKGAGAAKGVRAEPVRRFTSKGGFEILCGKSGRGNDMLVKKLGKPGDLWFHAKGVAGAHVLLKFKGKEPLPKSAIEEAATVAASYSKAAKAAKVEVLYSDVKNVRKPRGAKPGMVTVSEYKTVVVRPVEDK